MHLIYPTTRRSALEEADLTSDEEDECEEDKNVSTPLMYKNKIIYRPMRRMSSYIMTFESGWEVESGDSMFDIESEQA